MDSYLQIAQTVLRSARRPMRAKAILDVAYQADAVPPHLYGKTQQKTLQARLSEDILHHRETSPFYRTEPGQFFLTEFLDAEDIPSEWKTPFPARRRTRDLSRHNTLAVSRSFLADWQNRCADVDIFLDAAADANALAYMHHDEMKGRDYCSMWTFSMVVKGDTTLAYRIGRYRDDRDTYAMRRSIGFAGALTIEDATLFSRDRLGAEDCATAVLAQDLDLSYSSFHGVNMRRPKVEHLMVLETNAVLDAVIVLSWHCPDWFEPTTRRLSLNEPHWLRTAIRHNDLDDFEPWSSAVLEEWAMAQERKSVGGQADHKPEGRISRV